MTTSLSDAVQEFEASFDSLKKSIANSYDVSDEKKKDTQFLLSSAMSYIRTAIDELKLLVSEDEENTNVYVSEQRLAQTLLFRYMLFSAIHTSPHENIDI